MSCLAAAQVGKAKSQTAQIQIGNLGSAVELYFLDVGTTIVKMAAITTNLLDVLAWFRKKRVSMRDLKPDNLFVAGDPARYPLFLRSVEEFSLGIIDVETAVDFEKSTLLPLQCYLRQCRR